MNYRNVSCDLHNWTERRKMPGEELNNFLIRSANSIKKYLSGTETFRSATKECASKHRS